MKKRLNITLIALLVICLVYCYWLNITLAKAKTITELRDNAIKWQEKYDQAIANMENAENQMEEEIQKSISGNPNVMLMFLLGRMVGRLDVNKMLIKIIDKTNFCIFIIIRYKLIRIIKLFLFT